MGKRLALVMMALGGSLGALALPPPLDQVPPACVDVDAPPVHLQVGYAPNGPEDCTELPPPA